MAWDLLPVDYTDAVWVGLKRYNQIDNEDGTISLQDVTVYSNKEKSFFGAKDANRMNEALNTLMSMVENGTDLYEAFQNYFADQKDLFEAAANVSQEDFNAYIESLKADADTTIEGIKTDYAEDMQDFQNQQEELFQLWFDYVKGQLGQDVAGNLLNEIIAVKTENATQQLEINEVRETADAAKTVTDTRGQANGLATLNKNGVIFEEQLPKIINTKSGTVVTATDASESPFYGLNLYGKTTQFTTTGKNLCDIDSTVGIINVLVEKVDNNYRVYTTKDKTYGSARLNTIHLTAGITYTLSAELVEYVSGTPMLAFRGTEDNIVKAKVAMPLVGRYQVSYTPTEDIDIYPSVYCTYHPTVEAGDITFGKIQLEVGDTATEYEPYTCGVASPNPNYPQDLVNAGASGTITTTVCARNLIDTRKCKSGTYGGLTFTNNGDGSYKRVGTATSQYPNLWLLGAYSVEPTFENTIITLLPKKTYYVADCSLYSNTKSVNSETNKAVYVDPITYPNGIPITGIRVPRVVVDTSYNDVFYPRLFLGDVDYGWESSAAQTLTTQTPNGLAGIPVETGGNYTDESGQEWICDEVDFARGLKIQRIGRIESYNGESVGDVFMSSTGELSTGATVIYPLAKPIETPLTADELAQYAALHTNKPNTTVLNNGGCDMVFSYVRDTDTKDYIDFVKAQPIVANAAVTADLGLAQARNIYAGTAELEAGTTALTTGAIYLQYE